MMPSTRFFPGWRSCLKTKRSIDPFDPAKLALALASVERSHGPSYRGGPMPGEAQ